MPKSKYGSRKVKKDGMTFDSIREYNRWRELKLLERAGKIEDFITLFNTLPKVDAGLAASIFHFCEVKIADLKAEMKRNGIPVREVGYGQDR